MMQRIHIHMYTTGDIVPPNEEIFAKDESFISVKHLLIATFIFSGSSSNLHPNAVAPPGSQQANQMFGANHQGAVTESQSVVQQHPNIGAAQQ